MARVQRGSQTVKWVSTAGLSLPGTLWRLIKLLHSLHCRPMYGQGMAQHADRAPPPARVDAFRNFREEGQMQLGEGAGPTGLAKLYEPPLEVMFKGSFEQVSVDEILL